MKPRLSKTEHEELGQELRTIQKDMLRIRNILQEAYSKEAKPSRTSEWLLKSIWNLRHQMDDQFFDDLDHFGWSSLILTTYTDASSDYYSGMDWTAKLSSDDL